ncbi:MAG: pyruvate kinase [Flavobacteriales bacterium]|nr:pyruvate kinase [Flavobacteriales bacterium]
MKRTKIVATIGPATSDKDTLRELVSEGVDVIRLNFSHGAYEDHAQVIQNIREINTELRENTAILADLQGPKLRVGQLPEGGILLQDGSIIQIRCSAEKTTGEEISTSYLNFARDVNVGETVLLDDGKLKLEVVETDKDSLVKLKVIHGGILTSKKGINLPNTSISLPSLTEKDLEDLEFALDHDVDWIGLSFVRSARDIIELRALINKRKKHARIIAKIEKPEAVEDIDNIIKETDAVMVARGDLGVEIPMQNVPILQKKLIRKCIRSAKPVIVATQMMESMIDNITPTRAEVNDVANAVLDGTDAVMLSGETSVGKHPVEVIRAISKIILEIEKYNNVYYHERAPEESSEDRFITDSVCYSACRLAKRAQVKAIVTMTFSGYTGFKISSQRPKAMIFAFTGNRKILTTMNLVWGVKAVFYDKMVSTDHTIADIKYLLRKDGYIAEGDLIINVASMPIAEQGMSNMIKLSKA